MGGKSQPNILKQYFSIPYLYMFLNIYIYISAVKQWCDQLPISKLFLKPFILSVETLKASGHSVATLAISEQKTVLFVLKQG